LKEKILFTWSGGKDSALALYELQKNSHYDVIALLTTVTKDYERISMHGVREVLLDQQASALGIPLEKAYISKNHSTSNEEYEAKMKEVLLKYKAQGISSVAFGDLYLEDVRQYREEQLSKVEMTPVFPLWGKDTSQLANRFISDGFKAIITCVDTTLLDKDFSGRLYDETFLTELPPSVDPCGENGEFHSFVFNGPNLKQAVSIKKGEIVLRDNRFCYCDVEAV